MATKCGVKCTCLLCHPVKGKRAHPVYGYDLGLVKNIKCIVCGELIGRRKYVEELGLARFGQMSFMHKSCETEKQAKARARMERNWHEREKRKKAT